MIKGQNRQAIVLIPQKNDIFDKVIFLVNPKNNEKPISQNALMEEAMRIIEENTSYKKDKKTKSGIFKHF